MRANIFQSILMSFSFLFYGSIAAQQPNILLVIADDLGVDYSNGYHVGGRMPTTPTLDSLRSVGITYENVFSAPKCTPSRAALMSGKHGVKTGVIGTPGNLEREHRTLFDAIEEESGNAYADALIGKWHLTSPADEDDPNEYGADYYSGFLDATVYDYYDWIIYENGEGSNETQYATTVLTNKSIDWINDQEKPWFLWLAHAAPHSPFQTPPDHLYTTNNTNNNVGKYVASIEAIDFELNRLLNSIPNEDKDNLLILFVGDNGTPNPILKDYPSEHGKSTLYQGGVRVPLIVAGAGVSRKGERESALINIADIHATILEATKSIDLKGGIENSFSFYPTFSSTDVEKRRYNYTEVGLEGDNNGWAIRNERFKLIHFNDGREEFYDLLYDSLELTNIIPIGLPDFLVTLKLEFEQEASIRREAYSCIDMIQNGDEEGLDCGGTICSSCITSSKEEIIELGITLSPNPVNETLQIKSSISLLNSVKIYNRTGQLLIQEHLGGKSTYSIPTSDLIKGIYFLHTITDLGITSFKFVKI